MVTEESRADLLAKGEQEYDEASHQIERGEIELAFKHFDLAENVFLQLQDNHWLTFIRHEKFRIYLQQSQLQNALQLADAIIEGYLDTHNNKGLALIHIHVADVLSELGEFHKALASLRIAEAVISDHKVHDLSAYLFSSLGMVFISLGDNIEAIQAFNAALQYYTEDSAPDQFAWCLQQIGICYFSIFDYPSAERYFVGSFQAYFKAGENEAGHEVLEQLRKLYTNTNQQDKLAGLNSIGRQKRY